MIVADPAAVADPAVADPAAAVVVDPAAAVVVADPVVVAPTRPDGLPDAFWDEAAGVKPEAYSRLAELEAAELARGTDVPADGKYVLALPDDMKGLDGQAIKIDAADPLAAGLVAIAAEHKLPAAAVNAIVAAYATAELAAAKADATTQAAEMAKLGAQASTRIAAAQAGLKAHGAEALVGGLTDAVSVQAAEKLLAALAGAKIITPPAIVPAAKFDGKYGGSRLDAIRAQK